MNVDGEHAKEVVTGFIADAKERWIDLADRALRKIAKLRWWELWKARDLAEECLGIGKYWNKHHKL